MNDQLIIKGARHHNLKNLNVTIPRNKLVVITGVSGSGKSSLAFDTIYAEGQRRYVESLSTYARQFLGQMVKPDVDSIEGLSPAIAIDQKTTSHNPRSTVGTVTEIYDYLRLLFARAGQPHCPNCHRVIQRQSVQQIVDQIALLPLNTPIVILAPIVHERKGVHQSEITKALDAGFVEALVNQEFKSLNDPSLLNLKKTVKHNISVVIDKFTLTPEQHTRITDAIELALKMAGGLVEVMLNKDTTPQLCLFSENYACSECGISVPELEPSVFSFNNPYGACQTCSGLGFKVEFDPQLIIPDPKLSFADGAIAALTHQPGSYHMLKLEAVLKARGYDLNNCFKDLDLDTKKVLMEGSNDTKYQFWYRNLRGEVHKLTDTFEGVLSILKRRYQEAFSDRMRSEMAKFMTTTTCPACHGARLRPEMLAVYLNDLNIFDLCQLSVDKAAEFLAHLKLNRRQELIAAPILKEILSRLTFLKNTGLEYLTLARSASTLSGGEAQRIRLASQLGSRLSGVLYVLDEPSIGLHQRDNEKLINTLKQLRDLGNTLLVVEHDEDTMLAADQIIDIGPGAGKNGGRLIAQGSAKEISKIPASITGRYLAKIEQIKVPSKRRAATNGFITIAKARANNLKNLTVQLPLKVLTVITGVSGSGKSTLINEILYPALANRLNHASVTTLPSATMGKISGFEALNKIINIDQSPIGRTPRSNPATYTGVFDLVRQLFSQTKEAKARGYSAARFSFNLKGGRCESCQGDGVNRIEMSFLPDVYVPCEMCHGARYNRDTLEIKFKDKNIADVLSMSVEEACTFFEHHPKIMAKLKVLNEVGLGYLSLGQAATTLSGGEAQRIKLATELSRPSTGRTLYLLDEPTTGLHVDDVKKLLLILHRLVDRGNTVIVIEHNLDVIKTADYIVDLGPEGGERGGTVVAFGTPEQVAKQAKVSYTGKFLAPLLVRN